MVNHGTGFLIFKVRITLEISSTVIGALRSVLNSEGFSKSKSSKSFSREDSFILLKCSQNDSADTFCSLSQTSEIYFSKIDEYDLG